jgi:hypothetical protein
MLQAGSAGSAAMIRLPYALALAGLAAYVAAMPSPAADRPIRSRAALERYLHETPVQATPLAPLPPASRRRFLAQLNFGPRGIDINLDEPSAELTHAQTVQLFALFGQEELAEELQLGLTPTQKAQRDREREEDSRRRGCLPEQCPESEIERLYDQLNAIEPHASLPDAQRFAAEKRDYDRLFARFQKPDRLRELGAPDLRLLARAVRRVLYAAPDPDHVAQLRDDLAEMQRRGMTDDEDFVDLYHAQIGARQFEAAAALRVQHPRMGVPALPAFVPGPTPPAGLPTALSVDAQSGTMRRKGIDLSGPLKIVVIAGCHFSEDAARAIADDAQLRDLFAHHSLWLAGPSQEIGNVADWNRQFGDFPMHVAWRQQEWSMLPNWSMPTYYVFRDGKLEGQFSGWSGIAELRQSLSEVGVLQPSATR